MKAITEMQPVYRLKVQKVQNFGGTPPASQKHDDTISSKIMKILY